MPTHDKPPDRDADRRRLARLVAARARDHVLDELTDRAAKAARGRAGPAWPDADEYARAAKKLRAALETLTRAGTAADRNCPAVAGRYTAAHSYTYLKHCVAIGTGLADAVEEAKTAVDELVAAARAAVAADRRTPTVPPRAESRPAPVWPTPATVEAELAQLEDEFGAVTFDADDPRRPTVSAVTGPVSLHEEEADEDVDFGRFTITLRTDRGTFKVVGGRTPPGGRRGNFHPHVETTGTPCLGDAADGVTAALAEGRVCDAFLLVRAVLDSYNPASAYEQLTAWTGATDRCDNCDEPVDDEGYSCDRCGHPVCDDCHRECAACGCNICAACAERDEEEGVDLCLLHTVHCDDCNRVVRSDDRDENGRCPACAETAEDEKDEEDDDENEVAAVPATQEQQTTEADADECPDRPVCRNCPASCPGRDPAFSGGSQPNVAGLVAAGDVVYGELNAPLPDGP